MNDLLTLAVPPTGVPRACLAETTDQLRTILGIGARTVVADDSDDAIHSSRANLILVGAAAANRIDNSRVVIAATLRRIPARDHVVARRGTLHPTGPNPFGIHDGARVGVSSTRQAGPLLAVCKEVAITALDGVSSDPAGPILDGALTAVILSELELEGFDDNRFEAVPLRPEVVLPAPAHTVFVLLAQTDAANLEQLSDLHHPPTERCVSAELELLDLVGRQSDSLGCLAQQLPHGAIRLMASLSHVDESLSNATVTKVAAVSPDPIEAARACFAAFEEIQPGL